MSDPRSSAAHSLMAYIESLPTWTLIVVDSHYEHMGAVICDAGLQAGINYRHVVYPRIQSLLSGHPEIKTTSGFLDLLNVHGADVILTWNGVKKLNTITQLAQFFAERGIETTAQLQAWLLEPQHLTDLETISGVGPKTVDYIQLLVGIPAVAVDVHLRNFVRQAGIDLTTYIEVRDVIASTAELMGVGQATLDHSIWSYMSRPYAVTQP